VLCHYQSPPAAIRRAGRKRLADYLRNRSVKGADTLAHKALTAAKSQSVTLPAEGVAAAICAELAKEVLSLKERLQTLDKELAGVFSPVPRPGSSLACLAWLRSSGPSSW